MQIRVYFVKSEKICKMSLLFDVIASFSWTVKFPCLFYAVKDMKTCFSPLSPTDSHGAPIYSQAGRVVKVQPGGLLYAVGWEAWGWGRNEWVFPHSGSFLPFKNSSHTFLVGWGERSLAWSGRHIAVANTSPSIIVMVKRCQDWWQCLGGRMDALLFSQFVIEALLV